MSSSPFFSISYRRFTPVVVSSETPTSLAAHLVQRWGLASSPSRMMVSTHLNSALSVEAGTLESVTLSNEGLEWVHVLSEGWATPLDGFMTEKQYLTCLHYQNIEYDGEIIPMPVSIVLPIDGDAKARIEGKKAIALKKASGEVVALLRDLEIYEHRKEERATRTFGINADRGHPYVDMIFAGGEWLVGGKIEVLNRMKHDDGMDQWRLSPLELQKKFT